MQITKAETRPQENSLHRALAYVQFVSSFKLLLTQNVSIWMLRSHQSQLFHQDSISATYCDVQVHRVRPEVDHDTLHGHGRQGDAPREEEEEDEAADEETHGHGDEHVQLPGEKKAKVARVKSYRVIKPHNQNIFVHMCVAYVRLGFSLTSLHGITATSRSLSPDETFLNNVGLTTK